MSQANFTEVLELKVNLDEFGKQLDEAAKLYRKKTENLPKVQLGGGNDEVVKSLKQIEAALTRFGQGSTRVMQNFGQTMTETADKIERELSGVRTALDRTGQSAKKLGEQGIFAPAGGEDGGFISRFFRKFGQNVPEFLAQVVRVVIAYKAMRAIFNLPFQVSGFLTDQFQEGFDFLQRMEDRAVDLQESLQKSVVFSSDLTKNFRLAGDAARGMAIHIEEVAGRAAVIPEHLERLVKAMMDRGGLQMVGGDLRELVELGAKLMSSWRAAGGPPKDVRRLVEATQQILSGRITPTNRLVAALKMSKQEILEQVELSKQQGRLTDELQQKLQAATLRLDDAGNRMGTLRTQLEITVGILRGALAHAFWDTFLQTLKELKEWLDTNKPALTGLVSIIGQAVANIAKMAIGFGQANSPLLRLLQMAARFAVEMEAVADAVLTLSALASDPPQQAKIAQNVRAIGSVGQLEQVLAKGDSASARERNIFSAQESALKPALSDKHLQLYLQAARESRAAMLDALATIKSELAAENKVLDQQRAGLRSKLRGDHTLRQDARGKARADAGTLNFADFSTAPVPFKSLIAPEPEPGAESNALRALTNQFRESLDEIKRKAKTTRDELRDLFAAREINPAEYRKQLLAAYDAERGAIQGLISDVEGKLPSVREHQNVKVDSADTLESTLRRTSTAIEEEVKRAVSSADRELKDYTERGMKESLDRADALFISSLQSRVNMMRLLAQGGLETQLGVIAAEEDALRASHDVRIEMLERERDFAREDTNAADRAQDQILAETQAFEAALAELRERRRQQEDSDRIADIQHAERMAQVGLEQLQANALYAEQVGRNAREQLLWKKKIADKEAELIRLELQRAEAEQKRQQASGVVDKKRIQELEAEIASLKARLRAAEGAATGAGAATHPLAPLLGSGLFETFAKVNEQGEKSATALEKTEAAAMAAAGALSAIDLVVGAVQAGYKKGGVMGAIGGGLAQAGQFVPGPVGGIMQGVGQVLSIFSSLFGRAAKKIGEEIRKANADLMKQYQRGQLGLAETISRLEAQRKDAIIRLSGKKGGKDQLKELLPAIDDQLFDLRKRQQEILKGFDSELRILRLHSEGLASFARSWEQINKQVKEYLDAGGDIAKANEFLSLSLRDLREKTLDSFNDAEREAIDNALHLNQMLEDRLRLVEDFKRQEFDLLSGGTEARRQSNAVRAGQELARLRKEHAEKIEALDREIRTATLRRDKEFEIFELAQDLSSLRRRDEELAELSLGRQLQKIMDMKAILAGITQNASGAFGLSSGFAQTVNITGGIHVHAAPGMDVNAIGGEIADAINRNLRYGGGGGGFSADDIATVHS